MEKVNLLDEQGLPHGVWEGKYADNTWRVTYSHGKRHGLYEYLRHERLVYKGLFHQEQRRGPWVVSDMMFTRFLILNNDAEWIWW
jgi:hypothetical protein